MTGTSTKYATLAEAACAVLTDPDPESKSRRSIAIAADWQQGLIGDTGRGTPPERPARPGKPELRLPRDMPRRRMGSEQGRLAFVHAIAHIELNAIDLAWDLIARFGRPDLPRSFFDDWVSVAADEAKHFSLLAGYLSARGAAYGDLPAHDGLWQAAEDTRDDLLARLALVPLVLEARGLDVTPIAIQKLGAAGDAEAVAILKVIGMEEVTHVAAGVRWFTYVCRERTLGPKETFQKLVRARFNGLLKPPFAKAARDAAGFPADFYEPLAALP